MTNTFFHKLRFMLCTALKECGTRQRESTDTLQSSIGKHSLSNSPVISGNKASLESIRRLQLTFSGARPSVARAS